MPTNNNQQPQLGKVPFIVCVNLSVQYITHCGLHDWIYQFVLVAHLPHNFQVTLWLPGASHRGITINTDLPGQHAALHSCYICVKAKSFLKRQFAR